MAFITSTQQIAQSASDACDPQVVAGMQRARALYREYRAYKQEGNRELAGASLKNIVHEIVLAKNDAIVTSCHDRATVAMYYLTNARIVLATEPDRAAAAVDAAFTVDFSGATPSPGPDAGSVAVLAVKRRTAMDAGAFLASAYRAGARESWPKDYDSVRGDVKSAYTAAGLAFSAPETSR
jgi:hypothetical protein